MTMRRRGIIAAGTLTVDRLKVVDSWPQEEHLAVIISTEQNGGGSAHNVGVDIRQLDSDMPVEIIGLLGSDDDGAYLLDKLNRIGASTDQLQQTDLASTAFTDVITDSVSGRRTFFLHRGACDLLTPDHFTLDKCDGRILQLGLLGVHQMLDSACEYQGCEYTNGWAAVLSQAQSLGIHTNLELVSVAAQEIRRIALPCVEHLDSIIINEYELSALTDLPTVDDQGKPQAELCVNAALSLINSTGLPLLVVHYPEAAIAVKADNTTEYRDAFVVEPDQVAGTVGAGDAFAAGVLYGIHEDMTMSATLELGHAVAAASLRSVSSVTSVESVDQCLSFARSV